MPFVPPKSLNKQNQGTAPVDSQNYRGWPLAKITFGISKKKQDDSNTNTINYTFASQSISTFSTNTTTNKATNKAMNERKSEPKFISKNKSYELDRDSTTRRKSAPESYIKKPILPSLKVDLLTPISSEIPYLPRKKNGEVVKSSLKK
ncbi:23775_t:CDS:1, partial [Dentiscutata erythropus]